MARNHAAEYAQRKRQGEARNLTTSQMRGHARGNLPKGGFEPSVRHLKQTRVLETSRSGTLNRYYQTVGHVQSGDSLNRAAKKAGISPATVNRINEERGLLHKTYKPDSTGKSRLFGLGVQRSGTAPVLENDGGYQTRVQFDARNMSLMGEYWNAVKKAQNGGSTGDLRAMNRVEIRDVDGNRYRLLTDIDAINEFFGDMTDDELEEFDRHFESEKVPVRRAA